MSLIPTPQQTAENAILDINGKQTYLGNSYLASTNLIAIATANTETPLMLLRNPAANQTGARSIGCFQNVRKGVVDAATGGNLSFCTFKFYTQPTITSSGTALTANPLRPAKGFSSAMTAFKSPTISSNGTFISLLASSLTAVDSAILLILDAGYDLLITATVSDNGTLVAMDLGWFEIG